jgi:S-methylmethionine-dependent homocysteine/selenocysteine methylase
MSSVRPILLDGGTGRELLRVGAPFRQPEWSALALIEAPECVAQVHRRYIEAGAQVITTNSYAVVPFHIGAERFERDGFRLAALAGSLARSAVDAVPRSVQVAGSLPPVCGSYRADLFDAAVARPVLERLVQALEPYVDLWLAETMSSEAEMMLVSEVLAGSALPWWVSYTLSDGAGGPSAPRLRSGEPVDAAVANAARRGARAVLFNCCQPEVIGAAVASATRALNATAASGAWRRPLIGAYANAFAPQAETTAANADLRELRADLTPVQYLSWVRQWLAGGADIVGGCCGVGPEHIALMREAFDGLGPEARSDW